MDKDRTRGERRYQTRRHSRRARRTEHVIGHWPWVHENECDWCAPIGRFRTRNALSCRGLGKQKGAPKLAVSTHRTGYKYRPTTMRRIWNGRLSRAWLSYTGTTDLDDVELPSGPVVGRRRSCGSW